MTLLDDRSNILHMTNATRQNLLQIGADAFMRQGYNSIGLSALLNKAEVPKGSFYHYFKSKEDFGLAVIDEFSAQYLQRMNAFLGNTSKPPLKRLKAYFDDGIDFMSGEQCKAGCLLGSLGQELAGQSEALRQRIDAAMEQQVVQIQTCLKEASKIGDLPAKFDCALTARLIHNHWQGAMLRAKVSGDVQSLKEARSFFFSSVLK